MLYEELEKDIRFEEGISSCMSCGTCTAICPAAEYYPYQPRAIAEIVSTRDDKQIEALLKSETIWYCGECMSCKTRCPRGNAPGLIIMALRALSIKKGYFTESEKGRQQLVLKRTIGEWTLTKGYCVYVDYLNTDMYPEQGPIFEFEKAHLADLMDRVGAAYKKDTAGALRNVPQESLDDIASIFEVTGASKILEQIEKKSTIKAKEMGMQLDKSGIDSEYIHYTFTHNDEEKHSH